MICIAVTDSGSSTVIIKLNSSAWPIETIVSGTPLQNASRRSKDLLAVRVISSGQISVIVTKVSTAIASVGLVHATTGPPTAQGDLTCLLVLKLFIAFSR